MFCDGLTPLFVIAEGNEIEACLGVLPVLLTREGLSALLILKSKTSEALYSFRHIFVTFSESFLSKRQG